MTGQKKEHGMNGVGDRNRSKQYILLIVGNSEERLQTGQLLQKFGYSLYAVSTVAAAMDFFCVAHPAGVIVDAALEGLAMLTLVRKDARFSEIPVILIRSSPGQNPHAGIRAAACLEKPVTADALYAAVQSAIENTSRRKIRVATSLKAKVGASEVVGAVTNLSEFGLFFQARDLLPVNIVAPVSFELKGRTIRTQAVVVYGSAFEEGSSREPGMGMKFITISHEDRALVKAFVLERLNEGAVVSG